jgi:hypothetical protein
MTDIFVSYARDDQAKVARIVELLDAENYNVWWDTAIHPGQVFADVINKELNQAKAVIVVWTNKAVKSHWVRDEADKARRKNKIIPIMMEDVEIPLGFGGLQTLDFKTWDGKKTAQEWQDLLTRIRAFVPQPSGRRRRPNESVPRLPRTIDLGKGFLAALGVLAVSILIVLLLAMAVTKQYHAP